MSGETPDCDRGENDQLHKAYAARVDALYAAVE